MAVAAVLESLVAPVTLSALRQAPASRAAVVLVSAAIPGRGMGRLREYIGLKISSCPWRAEAAAHGAAVKSVRCAAVVCEAQNTAIDDRQLKGLHLIQYSKIVQYWIAWDLQFIFLR